MMQDTDDTDTLALLEDLEASTSKFVWNPVGCKECIDRIWNTVKYEDLSVEPSTSMTTYLAPKPKPNSFWWRKTLKKEDRGEDTVMSHENHDQQYPFLHGIS